jgi:hypothetical protein
MSTVVTEVQAVETKVLSIKGNGTELPVLAIQLNGESKSEDIARRLIRDGGYGKTVVLMLLEPTDRNGAIATTYDKYAWGNGLTSIGWTSDDELRSAHAYIESNFNSLKIGDVIHVDGAKHRVTKVTAYADSNGNN